MKLETSEAVNVLLKGWSFQEVAELYGVSAQTVRNRWIDFVEKVEDDGLMGAAENYGVVELVNGLRNLSINLKSNELDVEECLTGLNVATTLRDLDLPIGDVDLFFRDLILYAKTNNIPFIEVADTARDLQKALNDSGFGYGELVDEVNRLQGEKAWFERELQGLRNEIEESGKDLERRLAEASVTEATLETYLEDKAMLEDEQLLIDDVAGASRVIGEFKACGFDAGNIINLVKVHGSLTVQVETLGEDRDRIVEEKKRVENDYKVLQEKKDDLTEVISVLEGQRESLSKPLQALKDLNRRNLFDEDIIGLRDLIVGAGYTVETLESTLKNVGGLRNLREKHLDDVKVEEAKLKSLSNEVENLQMDVAELKHRKQTIFDDAQRIFVEFESKVSSMFEALDESLYDEEAGLKASLLRAVNSGLEEADVRMSGFTENTLRRMKQVKAEVDLVRSKHEDLEVKIRSLNVELGQYRLLDGFSKLLLGVEMPRGERLRVVASVLQLVEENFNILGLDVASIRVLKDYVFRSS